MRSLSFLFLSLCFSMAFAAAAPDSAARDLAKVRAETLRIGLATDLAWLRLLHVKPNFWGQPESQLDGLDFFLAKNGKSDPAAELDATLVRFLTDGLERPETETAACRYPARNVFLREKLAGADIEWPEPSCPHFRNWFSALRGVSVSLVFSSYYLNNPSSTFGHTFIRINKSSSEKSGERFELLDYGVNFAANPGDVNAFIYPILGLFGGFPGTFTTLPYYYKVREYNNAESRDLWQYELSIPEEQVDQMVRHIWELGPTYADYWYLSENCSYFILSLLESTSPQLNLTDRLKKFVIPTDTVQVVWNTPGLVRKVTYRPSTRAELETRLKELTSDEKSVVNRVVRDQKIGDAFEPFPIERRRLMLDAAIDFADFRYAFQVQKRETPEAQFKNQLLLARSQIPQVSERLVVPSPESEVPHRGHGSRRWGIGLLDSSEDGTGFNFEYKFAYHDLLDPVTGYPAYAQITFFDFQFQYFSAREEARWTKFTAFAVDSLSPVTPFNRSASWGLRVGGERLRHEDCLDCVGAGLNGHVGWSSEFLSSPNLVAFAGVRAVAMATGGHKARVPGEKDFAGGLVGAGPMLLARARWNDQWTSLAQGWWMLEARSLTGRSQEMSLATQYSPRQNWGLRLTGVDRWFEKSVSLDSYFYY